MVAGLLSTVVDSCPLPPRFFSKLEELRVAEISQHLRLKSAFVGLQKLLDSKVDVINVKGIDLHERFYGDNLVRSARDIDILVADEAYVLLAQCLREAGYQKQINTSDERDLRIARWTGEPVVWMDPKLHVPIDVHILRASHYATLHKHSERIEMKAPFTQVMYRGLDRIELLKYLCQHAAKHGWSKIQWITDICRVLLTLPRDELLRLLSKEGQSQADFNMLLGFFLVQHIIIGTYGAHFSIIPPYRSTIYSLARIVLSQTMMSRKNSFAGWTKIRYLWLSNRSFLARMRCILSYLFTPTPQDIPLSNGKLSWHCLVLRGLMRPVLGVIRFCSQ
jgi:hypothetical protein